MKKLIEWWWAKGNKVFQITNYKEAWTENGIKPAFKLHTNGAKRRNGDTCYDWTLIIGYIDINYTNFNLQRK